MMPKMASRPKEEEEERETPRASLLACTMAADVSPERPGTILICKK